MSNQDKIKEIQDRILEKRSQRREITKDLYESIRLDEEELFLLEREWLKSVDGIERVSYDWGLYAGSWYNVECPNCWSKLNGINDDSEIEWEDNEIITCSECGNDFVVRKWEEQEM